MKHVSGKSARRAEKRAKREARPFDWQARMRRSAEVNAAIDDLWDSWLLRLRAL